MKKVSLLLLIVMVLATPLWLTASASENSSMQVTVYSEFFTDVKAGRHVTARLSANETDWQDLSCETTEKPGFLSCQFPEEYAGQQLIVYFTKNKVLYPYTVDVPAK